MKSKVLILAYEARPNSGTEAGLAENWARSYAKKGYSVTILSSGTPDTSEIGDTWDPSISEVIRLGEGLQPKAPQGPMQLLKNATHYGKWLDAIQLFLKDGREWHIIHHMSWGSVRMSPAMGQSHSNAKTVWGPLGGGQMAHFRGLKLRAWPYEAIRAQTFPISFIRQRIRFARTSSPTLTLATNDQSRRFALASGVENVGMLLADGIDSRRILGVARKNLSDEVRLLWLGRMVHSKRPDISLLLLKDLLIRGVKATLTFAGDGPELPILEKLSITLGIKDSVVFRGRMPWEEVIELYDTSDYLVFTSMRDSSCPSVLEAAARGVPSLVLRHQGVGSMVPAGVARGPKSWRGDRHLVSDLASDIMDHVQNPQHYASSSRESISWAREQTWDKKVSYILQSISEQDNYDQRV